MKLTISQALRAIAKLKGRLVEAQQRAQVSVTWNKATPPAYGFEECVNDFNQIKKELVCLEARLRETNANTRVSWQDKSISLAHATLLLSEMKGEIAWFKGLPVQAQGETIQKVAHRISYAQDGGVLSEITTLCALPEAKRNKWVQKIQDDFDALNNVVETVNHQTPLRDL